MRAVVAILLSLLVGASGFTSPSVPTSRLTSSAPLSAASAWRDDALGAIAPMGYFDPLGLSRNKDDATMKLYREAELKHGRVAMAACLGWYVTAAGVHPAFNSQLSSDPLKAMAQLPLIGWVQFVLGCGAIEWMAWKIKERPGYQPGDILGAAEWVDNTDEGWVDYQTKEINNGRLAMIAISGIFVQDVLFGKYGDAVFGPFK
ncbi:hypothetical protein TrVE_jg11836 [Triparma verrucosa]|uniref:Uncharacterized protein n=2 Tax=Triparma TaxID=722752 RepID=A0A9W7BNS6_9STRA|nr:hypothetical protein TrVE_jg11836 [Triparma verrucosa]GMH91305.1 hypothetical protein TrST_g2149 [Triparma strigata]